MPSEYNDLAIKAVEASARLEAKVSGVEQSVLFLREEARNFNKEVLARLTESSERLAGILENISHNNDEHKIIHKRVDDVKHDAEGIKKDIIEIKHSCSMANHTDMIRRIAAIERQLDLLVKNLKIVNHRIKGVPIWMILVAMVLFSFALDMFDHTEYAEAVLKFVSRR